MSDNEENKNLPIEPTEATLVDVTDSTDAPAPVVDTAIPVDAPTEPVEAPAAPEAPEAAAEEEPSTESWTIYVKTLTGKTVTLTVEEQGACIVSALKDLLQAQEGYVYYPDLVVHS